MSLLVERSMGEVNEERKPVYPLFQKGASESLFLNNTYSQDTLFLARHGMVATQLCSMLEYPGSIRLVSPRRIRSQKTQILSFVKLF